VQKSVQSSHRAASVATVLGGRRNKHWVFPNALTPLLVLPALLLTSCGGGSDRSAEAYCRAFYETAAPIRQGYVEADNEMESDPLGSIVTLLGSPGDLEVIFSAMVEHAPDEIRPDTEAVQEAMKKEEEVVGEGLSDPIGALGKSLGAGLSSSGSFIRVERYLDEHCPVNSELAQSIIKEAE
jgi:hypothetical protein